MENKRNERIEAARKEAREVYCNIGTEVVAAVYAGDNEKISSIAEMIKLRFSELDEKAKENTAKIDFLKKLSENLNSNYTIAINEAIENLVLETQVLGEKSVPYAEFLNAFSTIDNDDFFIND